MAAGISHSGQNSTRLAAGPPRRADLQNGMIMKCMQSSCSGRHEGRQATVLACFPSGERCPSCDECARYWLGLRPGETRIEPLESYRDPLEEAREALAARTAPPPAPQPVTPPPAAPRSVTPAPGAHRAAVRSGWQSNLARWFTLQPTVQAVTPPPPKRTGWQSNLARWFLACLASVFLGIMVTAGALGQNDPQAGTSASAGLVTLGVIMIVAPILFGIIAVILLIVSQSLQQHAAWLAQHTPEQRAQIRAAERAAFFAATTVTAVALHEHNKHNREKAAAAWQASHASYVAQQQHQQLIDAIQAQQPPAVDEQTAATQRLLAQSAANRNNKGWS
jgi:hypothetical protein